MSSLSIRISLERKNNLDDAALRLGYTRRKKGNVRGDMTALLNQIADALPSKSPDEIRRFLMERGELEGK